MLPCWRPSCSDTRPALRGSRCQYNLMKAGRSNRRCPSPLASAPDNVPAGWWRQARLRFPSDAAVDGRDESPRRSRLQPRPQSSLAACRTSNSDSQCRAACINNASARDCDRFSPRKKSNCRSTFVRRQRDARFDWLGQDAAILQFHYGRATRQPLRSPWRNPEHRLFTGWPHTGVSRSR